MKTMFHPDLGRCWAEQTFFFKIFTIVSYFTDGNRLKSAIVLTSNLKEPILVKKD